MIDEKILNCDKEYDHQETKRLLMEVKNFCQIKLKMIVPEWITSKAKVDEISQDSAITCFYIEKAKNPIYEVCSGYGDVDKILGIFEDRLNDLLGNMDELLDRNVDLDDESKKSLESYASAIDKCFAVYSKQQKRRSVKIKELSTVDEIKEELQQLFTEIIANYIIAVLFDALYERINNGAGQVYEMVVKEINNFLALNGVYTRKICIGEKIEPEYMEPTQDSSENYTDDFNKFDTIDEIRRYPYLFADDTKIIDGQVRIWRRKD